MWHICHVLTTRQAWPWCRSPPWRPISWWFACTTKIGEMPITSARQGAEAKNGRDLQWASPKNGLGVDFFVIFRSIWPNWSMNWYTNYFQLSCSTSMDWFAAFFVKVKNMAMAAHLATFCFQVIETKDYSEMQDPWTGYYFSHLQISPAFLFLKLSMSKINFCPCFQSQFLRPILNPQDFFKNWTISIPVSIQERLDLVGDQRSRAREMVAQGQVRSGGTGAGVALGLGAGARGSMSAALRGRNVGARSSQG